MKYAISALALFAALPAMAEDNRQLDAHEHGVGELNIAIDGDTVAMEFHAPGADIVGFEYQATSDEDLAKIDAAIATLNVPGNLFVLPTVAGCSVTAARAELETEDAHGDHDDHGHDDHAADKHNDHDHAEEKHDDHDHGDDKHEDHAEDDHKDHDHAEDKHDDHDQGDEKHEDHAEDDHKDHDHEDHEDHAGEAGHTEFHAEYTLTCSNVGALTDITLAYFDVFPNAKEVEVQVITTSGAQAYEVERDAPKLSLGG